MKEKIIYYVWAWGALLFGLLLISFPFFSNSFGIKFIPEEGRTLIEMIIILIWILMGIAYSIVYLLRIAIVIYSILRVILYSFIVGALMGFIGGIPIFFFVMMIFALINFVTGNNSYLDKDFLQNWYFGISIIFSLLASIFNLFFADEIKDESTGEIIMPIKYPFHTIKNEFSFEEFQKVKERFNFIIKKE